ncbi:hypothetical protein [Vibrio mangrovi]|uniref:Uncharacterized protein n=1 Tax=Vibrio mangrovi TaxID=474394 RepID=A0A1Y6J1K3_9VIBR|nr:hypothetical protein [Vibrio mangrovi]MDW6005208.1 hypothetical protein [Vibrio mangrovi]SMS02582.1 hypothetical protein VIM7927_03915 [Vibrio mangrovi]
MYMKVERIKNNHQSVTHTIDERKEGVIQKRGFFDHRPESINQPSMKYLIDNRSTVFQLHTASKQPIQFVRGVNKQERTRHLNDVTSLRGHIMYARDHPVKTRKAGRKSQARSSVKKKLTPRERFFTHTEGHYVRTLNKRNVTVRAHVDEENKVMTHVLQGRLDMCKNCQQFLLPELKRKYPRYTHQVHYSFHDLTGSRTFWNKLGKKKMVTRVGNDTITRYNESER